MDKVQETILRGMFGGIEMRIIDTHEFNKRVLDHVRNDFSIDESNKDLFNKIFDVINSSGHLNMAEIIDTLNLVLFTVVHSAYEHQVECENRDEEQRLI